MRIEFVSRGVTCLAAMPPTSLDLPAFEHATELGRPVGQVVNPQVAVADYGQVRILVALGQPINQVQLEAPGIVSRELCRRAADELIRQASPFGMHGVGFNGFVRIDCGEDEQDPVRDLVNADLVIARLQEPISRTGIKLVYPMDGATVTIDISPVADNQSQWFATINRHHLGMLNDDDRRRALDWFASLNDEMVRTVSRLFDPNANEAVDAA